MVLYPRLKATRQELSGINVLIFLEASIELYTSASRQEINVETIFCHQILHS